jgi:hypothetical protein
MFTRLFNSNQKVCPTLPLMRAKRRLINGLSTIADRGDCFRCRILPGRSLRYSRDLKILFFSQITQILLFMGQPKFDEQIEAGISEEGLFDLASSFRSI